MDGMRSWRIMMRYLMFAITESAAQHSRRDVLRREALDLLRFHFRIQLI
jgi:hypothetical protein